MQRKSVLDSDMHIIDITLFRFGAIYTTTMHVHTLMYTRFVTCRRYFLLQTFTACSISQDYESYVFDPPIVAKKVCINPTSSVTSEPYAMRFELYGCELNTTGSAATDSGTVDHVHGNIALSSLQKGRVSKIRLCRLNFQAQPLVQTCILQREETRFTLTMAGFHS